MASHRLTPRLSTVRSGPRRAPSVLVFIVIAVASVSAHDLWIEPTAFAPEVGALVSLRLRVGVDFIGAPVPRDPTLVKEFVFDAGAGKKPVIGRDRADPAGVLRVSTPGMIVAGYSSHPSRNDQAADKFNQYLAEEGLESIAKLRASRQQSGLGVREIFSRCAKTLIRSGATVDTQGDRTLGFPLELVAERNPYALKNDQDLPVRLTYENRPLSGALVVAMNRTNPTEKLSARTDGEGRVRFRLAKTGVWLVKAVHMVAAPAGANADWASYWASLTFERP